MKTIDQDIKTGQLKQIYLLYGTEAYLRRQYRDKLKNALCQPGDQMNFAAFTGKNVNPKEIIDLAETLPFLAERRVILLEDSGFFKNSCEELAQYLTEAAPTVNFIFVEEEVDKRSKMYKAVKKAGSIIEFSAQSEELLTRWILSRLNKEGKQLTSSVMRLFLDKTGTDMENIDKELEKLICYTLGRNQITAEDVEAVVTEQTTNKIFEMVNAVAEHNQRKALDLYYDLLALKEAPMRIFFLINRQFQILFQIREMAARGMDSQTMAKIAGIPPFAVKRHVAQAKGFAAAQLKQALQDGAELEEAVKTGRMNDRMAVELFLITYSWKCEPLDIHKKTPV